VMEAEVHHLFGLVLEAEALADVLHVELPVLLPRKHFSATYNIYVSKRENT